MLNVYLYTNKQVNSVAFHTGFIYTPLHQILFRHLPNIPTYLCHGLNYVQGFFILKVHWLVNVKIFVPRSDVANRVEYLHVVHDVAHGLWLPLHAVLGRRAEGHRAVLRGSVCNLPITRRTWGAVNIRHIMSNRRKLMSSYMNSSLVFTRKDFSINIFFYKMSNLKFDSSTSQVAVYIHVVCVKLSYVLRELRDFGPPIYNQRTFVPNFRCHVFYYSYPRTQMSF